MKKNNAGFSLIELIVVISVMVILTAVGGTWIVRLSGYRARECASKISSSLTQAKVQSMSKSVNLGDSYWMLERDASDNKYYVTTHTPTSHERIKVGKTSNISVKYVDNAGTEHDIATGSYFVLAYARNTGEIFTCLKNTIPSSSSDYKDASDSEGVKQIMVTNGSRTYTIDITAKTGKVQGRH